MTVTSYFAIAPYPMLFLLQMLPALGALALWRLGDRPGMVTLARLVALAELVLAADLYRRFDADSATFQFAEHMPLLGPLQYHAAADGVTVLFVLLTALILLLVLSSHDLVRRLAQPARLLAAMLAIEALLMTMLVTVDLLWFTLGSVIELALIGYLLGGWSTSSRGPAARARFVQFQAIGLLLLLAAVLLLGWHHAQTIGRWSFDLADLLRMPAPPATLQSVAFFLLFYGLALRTPLFPLHGWLPGTLHHGMVAIAPALLLGIKVGIYGMVRYLLPLLPDAVVQWQLYVAAFAGAGVFYAAILAFLQTNLRRLMAFAVVSHTSLLIVGLFSLHAAAFQGSVLLAVVFGLAATGMMLMVGLVFRRTQTTQLDALGGLFDRIPFIALAFLVSGLSIVGMPGTPGFDAAHLVLEASLERYGALATVAVAVGNVVAAGFLLWAFQRAFLAPPPPGRAAIEKTQPAELWIAGIVLVVLLGTGFYLDPWLKLVEAPLTALAARFGGL